MAHLSLSVLGSLQVSVADTPVTTLRSDKVRALLAYLAVESDRPHRRETLVGLLWPDCPEQVARHNLRQALFNLRLALGDHAARQPYFLVTREAIQFNRLSDYSLDLAQFNTDFYTCERNLSRCLEDCPDRAARLEEGVKLYRGEFLHQFSLQDSEEFEEWTLVQRENLHQHVLDALAYLVNYYELRADYDAARRHALRQLELDPWREEAHRQLMRVLALDGQSSAALAQYETCRRVLAEELGVEPSAKTGELYEQIRLGTLNHKTELITSKLFIPPLRPGLVPRLRLVQALNEGLKAQRKLTLVSAPAGFGKTTLVVAWLKQIDLPAAWLSLDDADNDLRRFLAYLAAAFQQVDEQIGVSLLGALQSPQLPSIDKVLTALLNEIALRTDPLILVLDDVHLLTQAAILEVIAFLLHHQPPPLHLVLTTREDPDLPLARLRARDQLTEIRARELRFTQAETGAFLQGVMGLALSEQDVAVLEDRTEGWAAGLQLAGLSMQKQADLKAFIADFSGSQRHILDYLTDEVLQQQPEGIRTFLLQTAILDRFSGPLTDALTGRNDGDKILVHLEAANLFVIPLDEERRWYRYHHLFSDLLRSQLARSQPEWIPELHRRASRWYEENGDIYAAIDQALQDADLTRAAQLIQQHAIPKLYHGEVAVVMGWFDRLPEAVLLSAPMLCISKAWASALMRRDTSRGEVERALQAADHALDRVKAGAALRDLVAGHAASIQAYLLPIQAMMGQKPERLIALSQEAQRLLPVEEKGIRSVNALKIGHGYLSMADLEAACHAYKQALEDGLAGGNLYAAIYGPINLVSIALLLGHLREALQLCDTYIERFNQILAGQNFPPIGALYIQRGRILVEYNRLAEAEPVLLEGLDLIRWTGEYDAPKTGYTDLARLHASRGDRSAMLEAIKALEEAWPEGAFYAQTLRHRLSMRHWPDDPEVQKDAQTWLAQSRIEFGKLAAIQRFYPLSMAYLESYLGAAHVLARLAEEIPGIYMPGGYPLDEVQAYLMRQQEFAAAHEFAGLVVEIAIARALLYKAAGMKDEALKMLEGAVRVAAPTGLLRVFLDELEPLQALLEELKPRLTDEALKAYANRLLESFNCGPAKTETGEEHEALLSERELEVLRCLARGLSYEEVGRQLFLSLNTVQFHVKNIYRKLLVNKRVQAIEKAREMKLI